MADYPESIESTCTDAGDLNVNEDAEEHRREEQQDGNENNNEGDNERRRDEISQHTKFAVRTGIRFILFFTVLSCITFSKLTLIRLADRLRTLTVVKNMSSDSEKVSILRDADVCQCKNSCFDSMYEIIARNDKCVYGGVQCTLACFAITTPL